MRAAICPDTPALWRKEIAELVELPELPCKDQVMHPVVVLNFAGRDDADTLWIFKELLPFLLPGRVQAVPGTEHVNALDLTGSQKSFRVHRTGYRHRKGRMYMQIGIYEHEYIPELCRVRI
jgi:hypothetical protein